MENKRQNRARLVNKVICNEKYTVFSFEILAPFFKPFVAGQYVSFQIGEDDVLRSYSICSAPTQQNKFEIMVDMTPHGIGTTFLQNAEIGAEVDFLGPLGRFVLSEQAVNGPVFLIGTGSGVAPLRSMLYELLEVKKTTQQVELFWGERFSHHLIWVDELKQLQQRHPNFKFTIVVSQPGEQANETACGRVTDIIRPIILPEKAEYYLCGNKNMIADMSSLLQEKWVQPGVIFHEKFY